MVAVQAGEDLGDLAPQHPQQRQLGRLQHRHLGAGRAGGGRRLQADPARADHHDPGPGAEYLLQPLAVLDPAQVEHPGEVGARHGQPARRGAGGEQQLGVGHPAVVGERHGVRRRVDRGDGGAEPQGHVVVGVPLRRVDVDLRALGAAEQVALGQRRTLVRALVLLADQHHRPVVARLAQGLGGLRPGEARPHDHERPVRTRTCCHGQLLVDSPGHRPACPADTDESRPRRARRRRLPLSGDGPAQGAIASRTSAVSVNCSNRTIRPPRTTKWCATRTASGLPVALLRAVYRASTTTFSPSTT